MKLLDIGTVAATSGLPASTLRYYEELGLIAAAARHGLRRQFEPFVLMQLSLIALARQAGFTLAEIGSLFGRDGRPDLPRDQFRRRAQDLQQRITELAALRDLLLHIADCSAPSHLECPSFRRLLSASLKSPRPAAVAQKPGKS